MKFLWITKSFVLMNKYLMQFKENLVITTDFFDMLSDRISYYPEIIIYCTKIFWPITKLLCSQIKAFGFNMLASDPFLLWRNGKAFVFYIKVGTWLKNLPLLWSDTKIFFSVYVVTWKSFWNTLCLSWQYDVYVTLKTWRRSYLTYQLCHM